MSRRTKVVIEEVFNSSSIEDRKRLFNEIFVKIIKKSEAVKAI